MSHLTIYDIYGRVHPVGSTRSTLSARTGTNGAPRADTGMNRCTYRRLGASWHHRYRVNNWSHKGGFRCIRAGTLFLRTWRLPSNQLPVVSVAVASTAGSCAGWDWY